MRRKIIPVILALFGLGTGIGAGLLFRPAADPNDQAAAGDAVGKPGHDAAAAPETSGDPVATGDQAGSGEDGPEYVRMNNQFVVPVLKEGRVDAMVVLSISLEVEPGNTDNVFQREPKLRAAFLQVLFDHANVGGFSGSFTDGSNLIVLQTNLKEAAALILGTIVRDVLITDIARQDS